MTTLATIRTRVRTDLHDTDSGDYRWTDEQIDRHIEHALADLSLAIPQEKSATIETTEGSRDLSLAALTDLIEVEAVEYPLDHYPVSYVRYSTWESTLTLLVAILPTGDDARIYYTAKHIVDGSGSTLPPGLEDALAMGAAGYAATEMAVASIDRITTGPATVQDYARWGEAWLTAFRQILHAHGRRNRLRAQRMYVPA